MTCYCGHVRHNGVGLCLAKRCFCLIYRPKPTGQGVQAPAGGKAPPSQGQKQVSP